MKKKKVLLVNTQLVERYISGFTNRFIGLWCHVENNKDEYKEDPSIHWITNRSLWIKYFGLRKQPSSVTIISADLTFFKFTSRLFYPLYILYIYYRHRCTSVHLATSIVKSTYLLRLFRLFRIPHCITFASNSLDMAAYQSERMRNHWKKVFDLAQNVDVLNPTNSIQTKGIKHISPASFPYMMEFNNIPEEKFFNSRRRNLVVFCGSFVQQKNPLLAIEGFEKFMIEDGHVFPDTELWMFGKGDMHDMVTKRVKQANEKLGGDAIKILPDTQLIECLSEAKIFLSLQDYDNYPSQSIMEAMLFCNSILSIDNGDTRRLVKEENNNVLVKQKDPQEIARGIKLLLEDWKLNKANREWIIKEFSPKKFARYFFDLHDSISN